LAHFLPKVRYREVDEDVEDLGQLDEIDDRGEEYLVVEGQVQDEEVDHKEDSR